MRFFAPLLIVTLLAGCASEPATEPVQDIAPEPEPITVPDALAFSGQLQAIAEPAQGTTTGCTLEQGCAEHAFTIEDTLLTTLTLVSNDGTITGTTAQVLWGADYDLTLLSGSDSLGESTNPGEEEDVISIKLQPGTYTARVMAWNDQDGSYDLTIEFAAPASVAAVAAE